MAAQPCNILVVLEAFGRERTAAEHVVPGWDDRDQDKLNTVNVTNATGAQGKKRETSLHSDWHSVGKCDMRMVFLSDVPESKRYQ